MYSLFENLLAARVKPGDEFWVQFIVIAAIVGFSIIKAIVRGVKTMAEQKPRQEDEEKPQRPLTGGRGKYVDARGDYKTLEQLRAEKITQIRAAFGIPEPPPVMAEQIQSEPLPEQRPVYRPVVKRPPPPPKSTAYEEKEIVEPARPMISKKKIYPDHSMDKKHITPPAPPAETRGILIHLGSPQDLRSAILYQEILGPPIALR
jgi:hypothetical protein